MPRAKTAYIPLEREVQKSGIAILRAMGWECHRRNVGAMRWTKKDGSTGVVKFNAKSMADTWGTMPDGRRFELEFKRPNERPTPKQLAWLKGQNNAHCAAFWVDNTRTLQMVAEILAGGASIQYHEVGDYYDINF